MNSSLPRDADGYVDLDRLPDVESDFDVADFAETPPLADEVWHGMVASAPYADPSDGSDPADLLEGPAPVDQEPPVVEDSSWSPSEHEPPAAEVDSDHADPTYLTDEGTSSTDW